MQVINSVSDMQALSERIRLAGQTIALVPTMGFFHDGHLALMRAAKELADTVVVSLFVNPTQFAEGEDLEAYPRDLQGDLAKAGSAGTDYVFAPTAEDIYPEGFQTLVRVDQLTRRLCGPLRPGHFEGVTTIVAKLFNITKPHVAVFGQKDFQQLTVISRMVRDLNMDLRIVGVPTVREPDGLAMSSRNTYLSPEERKAALCLSRSLALAQEMVDAGERNAAVIRAAVEEHIRRAPFTKIDYVSLCHPATLEELEAVEEETLLALAVFVGKARLIDNRLLRFEAP
ncbi:MAG: pantoate--beta-alanine ligase [Thermodesulfobacteriota bacterium]